MKTVAIVAEYNPFHKGHEYHIKEAKKNASADYCIVVMSGDYVQRGEPSIISKYARAQMALESGADIVLELPAYYSTASAEFFASSSIAILDKLGVVDELSFGSEYGSIDGLSHIADILVDEPPKYTEILQHHLRMGKTFPFARNMAITACLQDSPQYLNMLSTPNNILGIEYLKALKRRGSKIIPSTVRRQGASYHNNRLVQAGYVEGYDGGFPSALSLRTAISEGNDIEILKKQIPDSSYSILLEELKKKRFPMFRDYFSLILQYKLLINEKEGYEQFADVSSELSARISKQLKDYTSYEAFCDSLKTKDITYARVSRALLHILLDIKQDTYDTLVARDYMNYAVVLGFRSESSALLNKIKKNGQLSLITKNADAAQILSSFDYPLFEDNIRHSHIYESIISNKLCGTSHNMYKCSPIII